MSQIKHPANPDWCDRLQTVSMKDGFRWLSPLKDTVESIVNFGCWGGSEPFALLWTLDATEIAIIEKEHENLKEFEDELERQQASNPDALIGRNIKIIIADMASPITDLSPNYYDLAYCENVLYYMGEDVNALQSAISEMVRIVKTGGIIVAIEPKFRAEYERVEQDVFGTKMIMPVRVSEPEDMSEFFTNLGLERIHLKNAPDCSYCYRKI